jgi:hypothetical protein
MSVVLPAALAGTLAATSLAAYVGGWPGTSIVPGAAAAIGLLCGAAIARTLGKRSPATNRAAMAGWAVVVGSVLVLLLAAAWPALLPPGGASDLTHHLMLVDVLDRTRHLVDSLTSEAALGEMAHYTPGLHLLIVIAGALAGMEAYRAAYPLLATTIALKAGFVFLIAWDLLPAGRARLPLAVAAVGLVLSAPRAYSVDGFLQAGFLAQVASELFVAAGWWAVARWWEDRALAWMAFAGLMGAAVFLTWPIWIGPLMVATALAVLLAERLAWHERMRAAALAVAPVAVIAMMHLARHGAWLRIAATSGAVPAFVPDVLVVILIGLAVTGLAAAWARPGARVTLWFAAALALQALALYALARARGAATPYMAMKMIYLAVYPAAVLGTIGLDAIVRRLRLPALGWLFAVLTCGAGLRHVTAAPVAAPIVNADLDAAGRWARANLQAACVDYIVDDAEQAYWLHLAVMGQPRRSARTAEIDGYTANRAVGAWIDGSARPYAIARRELLPGEVLGESQVVHASGSAVVIRHRSGGC